MATKKEKTTTTAQDTPIDWGQDAGAGFEDVTQGDLGFPFLAIIQKGSPSVDEDNPAYREDARPGQVVLSTTLQVLADKASSVRVVPVGYKKAYVEWAPRESGGGYVGVHDISVLSDCTKNEKGQDTLPNGNTIATTAYIMANAYDTETGDWINVVISMTSTQLKKARQWLNLMKSLKHTTPDGKRFVLPMYSHEYQLSTTPESNSSGTWYGWKIELGAMVTEAALVGVCREQHLEIAAGSMAQLSAPKEIDDEYPVQF